jgi:hypothetical protein
MEERSAARGRKLAEIEGQIDSLRAECEKLRAESESDADRFKEWRLRKRAAERSLAEAIGYLIDRPIVTIDEE